MWEEEDEWRIKMDSNKNQTKRNERKEDVKNNKKKSKNKTEMRQRNLPICRFFCF